MDPVTGLVLGCLTITGKTIQAIHGGWELYTKYQDTEQSVSTLLIRLETIDSALTVLQTWLDSYLVHRDTAVEMAASLERAIRGCHMVLSWLDKLVEGVKSASTRDKIKYIWNEQTINSHSNNLDSQVNALNLVVGILHLPTVVEQRKRLDKPGSVRVLQRAQQAASLYGDPEADGRNSIVSSKVGPDDPTYDLNFAFDHLVIDSQAYRQAFLRFVGDRQLALDADDSQSMKTLREQDDIETVSGNSNSTSNSPSAISTTVTAQLPSVSDPPALEHYSAQTHAMQQKPHETSPFESNISNSKVLESSELKSVSSVTDTTETPQLTRTPSTATGTCPLQPPQDNSRSDFETKIHEFNCPPLLTEYRTMSANSVWKVQSILFPNELVTSNLSIAAVGDLNGSTYLTTVSPNNRHELRLWRMQSHLEHWHLVEEQCQLPLEVSGESYFKVASSTGRTHCVVFGENKIVYANKGGYNGELHILGLHPFRWLPSKHIPTNIDFWAYYESDRILYCVPADFQFSLSENFSYCITGSVFHLMDLREPRLTWQAARGIIPSENGCEKVVGLQYCTKDQVFCFASCYRTELRCGHGAYNKLYIINLDSRTLRAVKCSGAIPDPVYGYTKILGVIDNLLVLGARVLERVFYVLDVASGFWYYLEPDGLPALASVHRLGVWGKNIAIRDGLNECGDIWLLDLERVRSLLKL